jgi:hypothetical protein
MYSHESIRFPRKSYSIRVTWSNEHETERHTSGWQPEPAGLPEDKGSIDCRRPLPRRARFSRVGRGDLKRKQPSVRFNVELLNERQLGAHELWAEILKREELRQRQHLLPYLIRR